MKLLNLKESAYQTYRLCVKGNETISYEQSRKKLTRNIHCAAERKNLKNASRLQHEYIYGCLRIIVRFGTIIEIENHIKDIVPDWKLDQNEYERISKELGIYDNKFNLNMKKRKYIY